MTKGSCQCGKFTYEWEGEPAMTAACYCLPCRKTAGHTHSLNFLVPSDKFKKTSGQTLNYTRVGESGKNVTYNHCADCGGLLFVEADAVEGLTIVKLGTVDDEELLKKSTPAAEIYTRNRFEWCGSYQGADQKEGGM